jgi:arylsulfatase A-like enzyme
VARLLAYADERTHLFVISDHGMGQHSGASYHLAEWLEGRGFMARHQTSPPRASLMKTGRRVAKNLLPVAIKETIKSRLGAERVKELQAAEKDAFYDSIDWSRSRAYTEPGRHVININLAGRNPQGIVTHADYEKVCAEIIAALSEWQDARGATVVEHVARRDEVYAGPFLAPGARLAAPIVYDLLPTVMYAAGLAVPGDLDGKVIEQAFSDAHLAANPLRIADATGDAASEGGALSGADEELIEEKLRSLGYL